jgi:3-oxoacyl-[acyl-carrier-protein] synthase III
VGEPRVPPRSNHGFPHVDFPDGTMIGSANGTRIGITGLGVHVPERIVTNDDLARHVDTSDEWIVERTGIRERRMVADDEALTDIALPAARAALEDAGAEAGGIDLLICATVTPDMMFPTSSALLADALGAPQAAAYDLLAGCTGFMYAVAQAYGMLASGIARRALVVGGDVLSTILDWEDRSTLVLFGDGAGAVVMEPVARGGFLGFELGADGGGGVHLQLPGSGSRKFEHPEAILKMNGREVYKFATRVMVSSAEAVLAECGKTIDEVDVYVPHQANKRIIDHAVGKLGVPYERTVVNVDRFGNTSSGSIPLALADARSDGRLRDGSLVLMTGMGAGLTWGSALLEWTASAASGDGG